MTKDILLHITGMQFAPEVSEEELDQIESIYPGEYYLRNGTHYLLYQEMIEGYEEPIKNMLKWKDKEVIVSKKGPFQVQMVFEEGKKTLTEYATPFGQILIGLDTSKIMAEETEDKICITIKYALDANYQFVADCEITILVEAHR